MNNGAHTIKTDVSRETLDRLEAFAALVKKWNPVINLVAKGSLSDIWHRHVEDSAQIILMAELGDYWIDIGSGGGFPGIVVAIILKEMAPATKVVLVESDVRKATFLRQAAATLDLSCEIHNSRIESLDLPRGKTISARALAPLPKLLKLAENLVEAGGICLFMKGQSYLDELADARKAWSFECEAKKSQTNAAAAVLKIRNIQRAAQ